MELLLIFTRLQSFTGPSRALVGAYLDHEVPPRISGALCCLLLRWPDCVRIRFQSSAWTEAATVVHVPQLKISLG